MKSLKEIRKKRMHSWKSWLLYGVPTLCIVAGLYVLVNALTPAISIVFVDQQSTELKLAKQTPDTQEDKIYVPSIGIEVPIYTTGPSNQEQLDGLKKGAIQRAPESGNPVDGGNYVVAAHRFDLQISPIRTLHKSPFYYIDKVAVGENVFVDYHGKRYQYKITEAKQVHPQDTYIESRTEKPTITLYSCTLGGAADGRVALTGELVGQLNIASK